MRGESRGSLVVLPGMKGDVVIRQTAGKKINDGFLLLLIECRQSLPPR